MNMLDLYSENIYTPVEEKQNERRFIFAVIMALLLHFGLFIALGMSSLLNHKRPDEIKIVNVQIQRDEISAAAVSSAKTAPKAERRNKRTSQTQDNTPKQSVTKQSETKTKQTHSEQTDIKQAQQPDKTLPNKPVESDKSAHTDNVCPDDTHSDNTENTIETAKSVPQTIPEKPAAQTEPDYFAQMTQAADIRSQNARQQWAASHQKSNEQEESAEDAAIKQMLAGVSAAPVKSDDGKSSTPTESLTNGDTAVTDSNNISWSQGTSRRLVSSGDIEPPEEIAVLGLKTSVTIRFEVFDNGLIGKVEILKSTGETEWDNDIAQQFKSKYKFEQGSGKASGTIIINMGY